VFWAPDAAEASQAYEKVNGLGERLQTPLRALDDKVQSLEKALRGESCLKGLHERKGRWARCPPVFEGEDLGEGTGCTDKQPPSGWGKNTCELQKNAGNCEQSWFRDHAEGYCEQTCGKCTADEWNVTDPTSCPTACGAAAGGGTPGTVACSTGTDSDCSTDDKPEATECPATANCGFEDLAAMTFKGGSKDEWLYVDATNAICISTTAESDPCSSRVAFANTDDTILALVLKSPELQEATNMGTVDMTLTRTPKEGATGFAGQQDLKAYTMMNQDSGALHSAIASGQLKIAYTPVYATVKSAVDHVIEYRKKSHGDGNKNDFLQGKVTLAKVSLCVGVVYVYNNSTEAIQGSDCAVKKSFEVTETKYSQLNATDGSVLYTGNWKSRSDSSPWNTIALDHIAAQLV